MMIGGAVGSLTYITWVFLGPDMQFALQNCLVGLIFPGDCREWPTRVPDHRQSHCLPNVRTTSTGFHEGGLRLFTHHPVSGYW